MKPEISIVIPTLDEADLIAATLDALGFFDENIEIIVVDGGSADATTTIAEDYGVKILHSVRGRGRQMQVGANAANGEILWFVHADTVVSPNAVCEMKKALQNPRAVGGNFTIRFDGERFAAKFLTWLYPRLNALSLVYGDSAIFVRRETYEKIGGFKEGLKSRSLYFFDVLSDFHVVF